jgi:hypothetical protein
MPSAPTLSPPTPPEPPAGLKSPTLLKAIWQGQVSLVHVQHVTRTVESISCPLERRLSWKYFYACRFAGVPYCFRDGGLRPVTQ